MSPHSGILWGLSSISTGSRLLLPKLVGSVPSYGILKSDTHLNYKRNGDYIKIFLFFFFSLSKNTSLVAIPGNCSCACTSHPVCNTQEEPIQCNFHYAVKYIHIRINFMSLLHFMQQLPLDLFNPDSVWLHLNP